MGIAVLVGRFDRELDSLVLENGIRIWRISFVDVQKKFVPDAAVDDVKISVSVVVDAVLGSANVLPDDRF